MKAHSTNYNNVFIEIAEDCPAHSGEEPPTKGDKKSIANHQFDRLKNNPYKYTSDDLFFEVFAARKEIKQSNMALERQKFFSKGQPCFRASPLSKRYGWGVHCDNNARIAIYAVESEAYKSFIDNNAIRKVKAMKSKK